MYPCVKCHFQSRHLSKLLLHYKFVHQTERDFQFSCSSDGCAKTYRQTGSYLKHVKRKHPDFYQTHFSRWKQSGRESGVLDSLQHVSVSEYGDTDEVVNENLVDATESGDNQALRKKVALFLLRLREESKLPSNVISKVVQEFIVLIGFHHAEFSKNIRQFLVDNGADEECLTGIGHIFNHPSQVEDTCNAVDSEYKLNKYIRNQFGYVAPVEYSVQAQGTQLQHRKYQYVPLLETLKALLQHDDVFAFVMEDQRSHDGALRDYCDGDFYRDNPLFNTESKALQIILYFDEFTASNPIGHKVKIFKLGGFYMLLGNVPPKYRSQYDTSFTKMMGDAIPYFDLYQVFSSLLTL